MSRNSGPDKRSILFVCLCNICRSPTAEAIFRHIVRARNLEHEWTRIDSVGVVDWHVGEEPDIRGANVLKARGITDYKHNSRQITLADFYNFYWILTVDYSTYDRLKDLAPTNFKGIIQLFGQYDPDGGSPVIRDPFFDDDDQGYVHCFERCVRASNLFLDQFYEKYPSKTKQDDGYIARYYNFDY